MSNDSEPTSRSLSVPRGQSLALRPGNALVTRGLRDIAQLGHPSVQVLSQTIVGICARTHRPVFLMEGPFVVYVQRGVAGYDECLEYAPLLKVMTRQDADDLFTAMFLLDVRCSFLPPTPAGYDKDIDDLTQFILCNPDDSRGYYYRALTFAERPKEDDTVVDFDRAIADYSEAIQLDPQFARAYHNRGNAYLKKGDRAKAESDIAEANRLDPTYGDYWRGLRDKPDSWWAALHQKMFGPATGEESSPPKKPPPSPTSGGPRR